MSAPDIKDLHQEKLSEKSFPTRGEQDFRLFMSPDVHVGIQQHATGNSSVEICGILVGNWYRDENGPFAEISHFIRCDQASSKFAQVTFTHDSWSHINQEMDTKYAAFRILGWYHTHPDFGIFLSDHDVFIHQNFFSNPGQVAYVVDPVRKLEGVFVWRNGKPEPLNAYWVGNDVWSVQASRSTPSTRNAERISSAELSAGSAAPLRSPAGYIGPNSFYLMVLVSALLFFLGQQMGAAGRHYEQQRIMEGTVSHYGFFKLLKLGLEDECLKISQALDHIQSQVKSLPDDTSQLTPEQIQAATKLRQGIQQNLQITRKAIDSVQALYGFSEGERDALLRLIGEKNRQLMQPSPPTSEKTPAKKPAAKKSDASTAKPKEAYGPPEPAAKETK
ncbi:MAG: hypothetical protein ACKVT0_01520 [Planctomycetaceae bacterium]